MKAVMPHLLQAARQHVLQGPRFFAFWVVPEGIGICLPPLGTGLLCEHFQNFSLVKPSHGIAQLSQLPKCEPKDR